MAKYRKIADVVDAVQLQAPARLHLNVDVKTGSPPGGSTWEVEAERGDWLVTTDAGAQFHVTAQAFAREYEQVTEHHAEPGSEWSLAAVQQLYDALYDALKNRRASTAQAQQQMAAEHQAEIHWSLVLAFLDAMTRYTDYTGHRQRDESIEDALKRHRRHMLDLAREIASAPWFESLRETVVALLPKVH